MKKITFIMSIMILLSSNTFGSDRYPTSIEFNTIFNCMNSRVGGLKNLNNPMMYNKVLEQCSCYMNLLENKYSLGQFMDLDSEMQKNPNGKIAKKFINYTQNTVIKECF